MEYGSFTPLCERAQWELNPYVGVGPLRFGMTPRDVMAALGGVTPPAAQGASDCRIWESYHDLGVTAIYAPGSRLSGVFISASNGPQVVYEGIQLIGHSPSAVRDLILGYASRKGLDVGSNWNGDPELPQLGLSLGSEGFGDTFVTQALVVAQELSGSPYGHPQVTAWQDHRNRRRNSAIRRAKPNRDRDQWDSVPWVRVGPLEFGMRPHEVSAALGGEIPAHTTWVEPLPSRKGDERTLETERYDQAGVTAHYPGGVFLAAVEIDGLIGPQVVIDGTGIIGNTPSTVFEMIENHAETHGRVVRYRSNENLGIRELGLYAGTTQAGDVAVSDAMFMTRDFMNGF
ncbi:hypothetical protein [Streptomyces tsukubensis]|uniref:hypothetical protein n=1 Tax=Streptomyces tsukubensis TaxID=83656 RepID=UPI00344E8525